MNGWFRWKFGSKPIFSGELLVSGSVSDNLDSQIRDSRDNDGHDLTYSSPTWDVSFRLIFFEGFFQPSIKVKASSFHEDQLVADVVKNEHPDLAELRANLVVQIAADKVG